MKDKVLRIRVPSAGKEELRTRAERLGLSMSEYVRLSVTRDLLQDLTQQPADAQHAPAR